MRNATLILPNADNSGVGLEDVHASLRLDLIDTFGGFTATASLGGWRDDSTGKVHVEAGTVYAIAMADSSANRAKLESIARHYGAMAQQVCVYVSHAGGDVVFVDSPHAFTALAA